MAAGHEVTVVFKGDTRELIAAMDEVAEHPAFGVTAGPRAVVEYFTGPMATYHVERLRSALRRPGVNDGDWCGELLNVLAEVAPES